ncbi:MAG: TonB-dependent receptor plug domain-containing protein [Aureispira sp.]|nr:TonB-dependent receptor plug domain-containing protein [Aureispira sp.]
MVRYIILLTLLMCSAPILWAQTTGGLQGAISDGATGESIPFANIVIQKDGAQIAGTTTDFDGNYNFSNVNAGTYDVVVTYVGYRDLKMTGVVLKVGQVVRLDLEFPEEASGVSAFGEEADIPIVIGYRIPLIEADNTTGGQVIGSEDIKKMATRSISSIAATTAGVNQADEGEALNSNGSRSSGNDYYVDGVRVIGNFGIPESEIDQAQIITSGVPAEFGDATGAIINIITKGPSGEFKGYFNGETSQFLDAFGANLVELAFSGPIIAKPITNSLGDTLKNDDGKVKKKPILGYRIFGRYFTTKDDRPSALGSYRLTDDAMNNILENPLTSTGTGLVLTSDYLTRDDLVETKIRPNARSSYAIANGKIELKPSKDFFFVVGGQAQFSWGNSASTGNRLFNYQFNPKSTSNTWRVSGRFRHSVSSTTPGDDDEEEDETDSLRLQPVFQNFSYELQGDYTETNGFSQDPRYQDRLWEYGYVGRFDRSRRPVVSVVDTSWVLNTGGDTLGFNTEAGHSAFFNTFDGYEGNTEINPGLAAYNKDITVIPSSAFNNGGAANIDFSQPNLAFNLLQMEVINGAFNVNGRTSVFGLFNGAHINGAGYGRSNSRQIRANVRANFDLVMNQRSGNPIRHAIQLGGVYEQRIDRSYSISPFSLWQLADQKANSHISNAADRSAESVGTFYDEQTEQYYDLYPNLIRDDEEGNPVAPSVFGKRFRESLREKYGDEGHTDADWVNVHAYNPEDMDIAMFEPTTLVGGRTAVSSYYGYDYLGNPIGANVQFNDFFTQTDAEGLKTRPVAPNKPIYVAGYLQDKFTYKDMIFRFGVRFDSYDANTKVLKDPYSLVGYYNASEFESGGSEYSSGTSSDYTRPSNIGDDFAVYVNANSKDASVSGYRDGEQWYDEKGLPVNNANELGSTIVPALRGFTSSEIDLKGENYDPNLAFRDYKPTLVVMPRISFSFPISDEANFYANYDVLAMRPPSGAFATPLTYFNFVENVANSSYIGNPNLKSQRTINYEVGFQQKLTDFSKVKVSMLYREERDLIQTKQFFLAYPITYQSFGNDDFSTAKSFKVEYDMRENNNLRILANYTLQFAEGTGSSPTSSAGVAAEELKYIFPLSFDQRHTFYLMADYRYKSGDKYNGPKIGKVDLLENTGLNLAFNVSSGRPFTAKQVPGGIGTSFPNRLTEGSINGARMPWNFRMDLKLDRDITIGKKSKHPVYLNVYLRIQNILNTRNVLNVYPVTGSPTDDGFLTIQGSPGPGFASSQADSYELLYDLRMVNPYNISRPRRIFIGLTCQF